MGWGVVRVVVVLARGSGEGGRVELASRREGRCVEVEGFHVVGGCWWLIGVVQLEWFAEWG